MSLDSEGGTDPGLPGLVLSTREEVRWARHLQALLSQVGDDATVAELLNTPASPGAAVRVDRARLWERLRHLEEPWSPFDASARALVSLAVLVTTSGEARLKICAVAGCGAVFADASNNLNRTHCAHHTRHRRRGEERQGLRLRPPSHIRNL